MSEPRDEPSVIDQWLTDPFNGEVVGGLTTCPDDGVVIDAWLDSLRGDPDEGDPEDA